MRQITVLRLVALLAPPLGRSLVTTAIVAAAGASASASASSSHPQCRSAAAGHRQGWLPLRAALSPRRRAPFLTDKKAARSSVFQLARGGGGGGPDEVVAGATEDGGSDGRDNDETVSGMPTSSARRNNNDNDEERYSRQLYTLGARAHSLVRSSTVYLDGPAASGLVYETAKNLALSGVGRIVLVVPDVESSDERAYHNGDLDDLGAAYSRAARAEVGKGDEDTDPVQLLVGYIQRLNPSIVVTTLSSRDQLCQDKDSDDDAQGDRRRVLIALDRPFSTQLQLNRLCRQANMAFVAVETFGVYGRTFCDFGPTFEVLDADGETPAVTPLLRLDLIEEEDGDAVARDEKLMVYSVEGEKHDVSKGDTVTFQLRDGSYLDGNDLVVSEVLGPFQFSATVRSTDGSSKKATDVIQECIAREAVAFRRVKVPQIVSFEDLEHAASKALADTSLFTPCDLDKSFDSTRQQALFLSFQAVSNFVRERGRLPTSQDDMKQFARDVARHATATTSSSAKDNGNDKGPSKAFRRHCRHFAAGCAAKFSPIQSVFAAIGAQEALKAVSGLYFPTRQYLMYDADEVLASAGQSDREKQEDDEVPQAPGLRHILGDAVVNDLQAKRIFVVGAGAIGCELLKNLASMGIATNKRGKIYLTDMDTIEKSNLSRQLLFRDSDIGRFKSSAAHDAARRLNPRLRIESHSTKVGESSHSPFNSHFWAKKVDVVLNALDNVEARLFMDRQCVANRKALVDAGTMGQKGNVQVVVPFQSESYASSVDPPEPAVPVCTLKNFPYMITHTIQWGRDLFDGLFSRRPSQANQALKLLSTSSIDALASFLVSQRGDEAALQAAEELSEDLAAVKDFDGSPDKSALRAEALNWACKIAWNMFFAATVDLMKEHPIDSLDEDGEPFWTGTRRPPRALKYEESTDSEQAAANLHLVEFVRAAARLRLASLYPALTGDSSCVVTVEEATKALSNPQLPSKVSAEDKSVLERTKELLLSAEPKSPVQRYAPIEFEKDDDSNGHVAFVNAASNLRAIAYGIPPVDDMETRRVAGNIVPAMITTTAFVSALSCIELVKLVQQAPLTSHRNAFINLALPFFAFTFPVPAERFPGLKGTTYSLWDRITIAEGKKAAAKGGLTMRSLISKIKKEASEDPATVEVASVSCGPYMLYANFLHDNEDSVLDTPIWDLISDAVRSDELAERRDGDGLESSGTVDISVSVDATVVLEDEDGNEVELPPVRITRYESTK